MRSGVPFCRGALWVICTYRSELPPEPFILWKSLGEFAHPLNWYVSWTVLDRRLSHTFFGKALGDMYNRSSGMDPEPPWTAA